MKLKTKSLTRAWNVLKWQPHQRVSIRMKRKEKERKKQPPKIPIIFPKWIECAGEGIDEKWLWSAFAFSSFRFVVLIVCLILRSFVPNIRQFKAFFCIKIRWALLSLPLDFIDRALGSQDRILCLEWIIRHNTNNRIKTKDEQATTPTRIDGPVIVMTRVRQSTTNSP